MKMPSNIDAAIAGKITKLFLTRRQFVIAETLLVTIAP